MSARRLLYISPVVPAIQGNGLAMRAGAVLEALAAHVDVSLLIVPLYTPVTRDVPAPLALLCRDVSFAPAHGPPPTSPDRRRALFGRRPKGPGPLFVGEVFDIVHAFRAATIPFARRYLQPSSGPTPHRHLDLDDIESLTSQRMADLLGVDGRDAEAAAERRRAKQNALLEGEIGDLFDRVYVCSPADRDRLRGICGIRDIGVLPNAVRMPPMQPRRASSDLLTLLFVGTLGYYPNAEGLQYFCMSVLPVIRERAEGRVRVVVAGMGADAGIQDLCRRTGVDLAGAVPDLDPYYRAADIVVVPVRAGGGTRIKVLEAFSYGVPVVSTSIGAEGIDAHHGEHLLIADRPEEFAAACLRLAREQSLARYLAENAVTLVRNSYSFDAMRETIDGFYSALAR